MSTLRIVVDENIPAVDALFGDLGEIVRLPGRTMTADDLAGADALLVRSVTQVNASLLSKSNVSFVGSCTIGTDHLDKPFFDQNNITWSAAPGCNAGGVVQYALAAMATYAPNWSQQTVGIVGCVNVGGRLYRTLKALGVKVKVADPFKSSSVIPELTTLNDVLSADVVCFHTPLTKDGSYPTLNLLNADNLSSLNPNALLISAGRGEVIDNQALYRYIQKTPSIKVVLDVWANEPDIYTPLMDIIECGTPHIAGYSFEGKLNGSLMIYRALSKHLGLDAKKVDERISSVREAVLGEAVALNTGDLSSGDLDASDLTSDSTVQNIINQVILDTYNIQTDNALIADCIAKNQAMQTAFDQLRKAYWQRREFSHFYANNSHFSDQGYDAVTRFLSAINQIAEQSNT